MTFENATEVRESITKYCISRGVALKFVKNERNRIRVKCQDQCPFVLLVSKESSNPGLVVKTLVPDHNCYRIFTNLRASATYLTQHYKTRILKNHNYKVKDMKKDTKADGALSASKKGGWCWMPILELLQLNIMSWKNMLMSC